MAAKLDGGNIANGGDRLQRLDDPGGLVSLTTVRDWRKKRRVGLDEQPVARGRTAATSRSDSARGNVTMPDSEMWNPRSSACRASSSVPVKQCMTPDTPAAFFRTAIVSSVASRVWMTTGRARETASATWASNTACWTARGAKS